MDTVNTSTVKVSPRFFLQVPWAPKAADIFNSTVLSKYCFHTQEVLFVGMKNGYNLFLIETKLGLMGLKSESVSIDSKEIMEFLADEYHLQYFEKLLNKLSSSESSEENDSEFKIFTMELRNNEQPGYLYRDFLPISKPNFIPLCIFQIYVQPNSEGYQFQQRDVLLKNQLWMTSVNRQGTDVKIQVQDKIYFAHKVILTSRSEIFKIQLTDGTNVTIENCDPEAAEEFLYFLYTGELMKTASSHQLLMLAELYGIKTLQTLCQTALNPMKQISGRQTLNFITEMSPTSAQGMASHLPVLKFEPL